MGITNNINVVLHHIRVKLYPNYLPSLKGTYLARTDNEANLSIEQVCAVMKDRGGFTGSYDDLVKHVKHFFDEAAYLLCDGFAVNTGYFSVHPQIGGVFNSENETHDHKKHPISFRFRARKPLRDLVRHISVNVTALAQGNAYIDEFIDRDEDSVNSFYAPGNMFCIYGNKIKVSGDHPDCGVFFVPVEAPAKAVKVHRIGENGASKITGIAPATEHQYNRIEIRTQFAGSGGIFLKSPRVITSDFVIEAA